MAYYYLISAFLILFFPRQITHLICFGRHRNEVRVKSKKQYYAIYTFWTLLFVLGCLVMGSAAKVNPALDNLIYCYFLESGDREYIELPSSTITNDNAKEYYVLTYYVEKQTNDGALKEITCKIIEDNRWIYEYYNLHGFSLELKGANQFSVYIGEDLVADVQVEKKMLYKAITYYWNAEVLNQRIK